MRCALLLLLVAVVLGAAGAEPATNDTSAQEEWIRQQIETGGDVDFNQRCGTEVLDPGMSNDARWAASCRAVNPDMLRAMLARPALADSAPHGVRLRGARIDGTLNLDDIHITAAEFTLIDCSLAGDLILSSAHLDGGLWIRGTAISGRIDARSLRVDHGMEIGNKTKLVGKMDLSLANIGDVLSFEQALLAGGVDAEALRVGTLLQIVGSEFRADLLMVGARIGGMFIVVDSKFTSGAQLRADMAQIGRFVAFQRTAFGGDVSLANADVSGTVGLEEVTWAAGKKFLAAGLEVGGFMAATNVDFGSGLLLNNARIRHNLVFTSVKFAADGRLTANGLQVGAFLLASPTEIPGGIDLTSAHIGGNLEMTKVRVGKRFDAGAMQVGRSVLLTAAELDGDTTLSGSAVHGGINLVGSKLAPEASLSVEGLHVDQDILLRDLSSVKPVNAISLLVRGSLDLRDATLGGLDLSGAVVDGDLRLAGTYANGQEGRTKWVATGGEKPSVVLRNTKIANLQDDEHAWDGTELVLEGFTYKNLGGVGAASREDMLNRPVETWSQWLKRDPIYSPGPYTQLATVLAASGNSAAATSIRFLGRDRERTEMVTNCRWPLSAAATTQTLRRCDVLGWLGLSSLQATVGYGIGTYTFRALWWTLGLALIGTAILAFAPGVRDPVPSADGRRGRRPKSLVWCFGASLSHVLPVVSLSPEFTVFFNDPHRERLYAWQQIAFAALALCGWGLSLFVVAAFSGLTQN